MDYDNVTKKVCLCSFISIVLIVLFIITPPLLEQNESVLTNFMKIIILIILGYTMYLNHQQTNFLKMNNVSESSEIATQMDLNIKCSYVFTFFLGLLFIFVVKNIFIL
jgi:hypothetical protein